MSICPIFWCVQENIHINIKHCSPNCFVSLFENARNISFSFLKYFSVLRVSVVFNMDQILFSESKNPEVLLAFGNAQMKAIIAVLNCFHAYCL